MILNAELNIDPTTRNPRWKFSNAELNVEPTARYSNCVLFWMQSWTSISELDIQDVVFECRAECWTHSSIFKVCISLNAELNVELTARYSKRMFSNAELDVEPIARYSNCVLFWMQSWMSISQLDIQNVCFRMQSWMSISELDIQDVVFECRAECRTHSSIFKVCFILNAELNVELTARYSRCMFSNAELNVEPIARYSKCVFVWMQILMLNTQLDIPNLCFRMQSVMSNP